MKNEKQKEKVIDDETRQGKSVSIVQWVVLFNEREIDENDS